MPNRPSPAKQHPSPFLWLVAAYLAASLVAIQMGKTASHTQALDTDILMLVLAFEDETATLVALFGGAES